MPLEIRAAKSDDADAVIPLIYSSGPSAFDFVFHVPGHATAMQFLRDAFIDGRGELGFRNHVVGVLDGQVVAAGAAWDGTSSLAFMAAAASQIAGRYGPGSGLAVMWRGLRAESVIRPPDRRTWYIAHLGVRQEFRSRGIGEALLEHLVASGRDRVHSVAALDVATTNPRAQALYERLGFTVTVERTSRLSNAQGTIVNHRRMESAIAAGAPVAPPGPRAISGE